MWGGPEKAVALLKRLAQENPSALHWGNREYIPKGRPSPKINIQLRREC